MYGGKSGAICNEITSSSFVFTNGNIDIPVWNVEPLMLVVIVTYNNIRGAWNEF